MDRRTRPKSTAMSACASVCEPPPIGRCGSKPMRVSPPSVNGDITYQTTPEQFAAYGPSLVGSGAFHCGAFWRRANSSRRCGVGVNRELEETCMCALNHQQPDRVVDLGGARQSGIAASTYRAEKQLGVNSPTRVFDLSDAGGGRDVRLWSDLTICRRPVSPRCGIWHPQRELDELADV